MGAKAKKSDYQASQGDKTNASIAVARQEFFNKNYSPLLRTMKNVQNENLEGTYRGRANADTQQILAQNNSFRNNESVSSAAETGNALLGQYGIADKNVKALKNRSATNVIGTAQGQSADANSMIGQISQLQTSQALNEARAKGQERQARVNAGMQIAGAAFSRGAESGMFGDRAKKLFSAPSLDQPAGSGQGTNYSPYSLANLGQPLQTYSGPTWKPRG